MVTITCTGFRCVPIPGGQVRLEIECDIVDPAADRMTVKAVAELLGKSAKQLDKLTRRQRDPLPVVRGAERHPYFFRSKVNEWLAGPMPPSGSASVQSLFSAP